MSKVAKKISELTERVWLRIRPVNRDSLKKDAENNGRTMGAQADIVFSKHYGNE